MDSVPKKKVSDRCKHGLGVGTCWLCKGHKPTPEWSRGDLMSAGAGPCDLIVGRRRAGKVDIEFMNLEDAAQESAGSLL